MSESRPAVVYGLLWAGLSLARALGRGGVRVTGIASDPNDFGLRSRYLAERHLTTEEDDERTLSLLRDAAGTGRPILFPERDENVHFVVRRWDEVRELADMPLPDDVETVLSLRRKDRLRVEAERVGLSIPATASPKDEIELRNLAFPPPYLIKAVTGQEFAYAFGHKVFVADDADSATSFWRQAGERGFETVVQELIPNAYERIYSLFSYIGRDGRPLANVVGRKVRQGPLRFGTSAIFLVQPEPRVLELGLRLLESVGYRGFAQVEFLRRPLGPPAAGAADIHRRGRLGLLRQGRLGRRADDARARAVAPGLPGAVSAPPQGRLDARRRRSAAGRRVAQVPALEARLTFS